MPSAAGDVAKVAGEAEGVGSLIHEMKKISPADSAVPGQAVAW